jgi:glycosyltransferase involved in cell wall biosynthesis
MTRFVKARHKRLEKKILDAADHIVTITPFYVRRFEALSGRRVKLLTNGFDEDDFKGIQFSRPEKFTIRHIGIIYEMANPQPFVEPVSNLINSNKEFRDNAVIEFIGEVNETYKVAIEQSPMSVITKFKKPVPHSELMDIYGNTSLLLLNIEGYHHAEGLLPGKIFEYIATGLPILAIGPPEGDASNVLKESKAGVMFSKDEKGRITDFILQNYNAWQSRSQSEGKNNVAAFSRRAITEKLTELLK